MRQNSSVKDRKELVNETARKTRKILVVEYDVTDLSKDEIGSLEL